MISHLNTLIPELNLDRLDIKVQYNAGNGGCFPMHFDTTPQASNRQITGTLYLNPDWSSKDGGELRVYPFPYHQLDFEPKNDRLVLFSSHQTLHRVLPSASPRYCITLWFSGSSTLGARIPKFSWLQNVEGIGFILNPNNRKTLSKVVYENDWAESIKQSFGDTPDTQQVLNTHKKEVELIKSKLSEDILGFLKDCLPLSHSPEFSEEQNKL